MNVKQTPALARMIAERIPALARMNAERIPALAAMNDDQTPKLAKMSANQAPVLDRMSVIPPLNDVMMIPIVGLVVAPPYPRFHATRVPPTPSDAAIKVVCHVLSGVSK